MISAKVVEENNGWPFHLLTEDIEFSVNCAIKGQKIGYCDKAVIYDEQPTSFAQSWRQRLRWSKGFYQVDSKYGTRLTKRCFSGRRRFSCYDMLMTVAPSMLLTIMAVILNALVSLSALAMPAFRARILLSETTSFMLSSVVSYFLVLLLYGAVTTLTEWKSIHAPTYKKILSVFTFPVFMFTYLPISLCALVKKVEWKPIHHGYVKTVKDF
jgi:cellulose synthase/poly-beta-1,6-N-acetylglucosamine synthase-like glycosyltransferase